MYHLSRRTTVGLLTDLFGVDLVLGPMTACEQAVGAAVASPVATAHTYEQEQDLNAAAETVVAEEQPAGATPD